MWAQHNCLVEQVKKVVNASCVLYPSIALHYPSLPFLILYIMPSRLLRQYAAVFFFAPLVQQRLRGHNFGLSQGDMDVITQSVRWGYITFALGISFLVVSGVIIFAYYEWLNLLYRWLMWTTLFTLLIGIWRIHHPSHALSNTTTSFVTNHMLTAFIPWYNRYLWYTQQDPQHPYRRLKESILWRYVIMVCFLFPWINTIGLLILTAMIIRIIVLAAGYDLLSSHIKQSINRLYIIHVDEIRSYINASIEKIWSTKIYQTLITLHKHFYRQSLPTTPTKRDHISIISYMLYGIILLLLLWWGRYEWHNRITAPLIFWWIWLLITYSLIRRQYSTLGPAPFIQPLIQTFINFIRTKHTT